MNPLLVSNKKTIVYQWELERIHKWSIEELKNRIWLNRECGQPIPASVSVEALRMELLLRGEEPTGYHEETGDIDMSNIEIEQSYPARKKKGR